MNHGRDVGDVGRGLRAVAWERCAGQVVQAVLAVAVLTLFPSPVRSAMPVVVALVLVAVVVLAVVLRKLPRGGASRSARFARAASADLREGVLARRCWPGIALTSTLVVAGHTATLLIAARTVGATASLTTLLPLAMLILLAMAVPTNIGGWGPREGAAAWLFAAAGLGADLGVAAAVAYGVMVFVASSPGAVVLAVTRRRRRTSRIDPATVPARPRADLVGAGRV